MKKTDRKTTRQSQSVRNTDNIKKRQKIRVDSPTPRTETKKKQNQSKLEISEQFEYKKIDDRFYCTNANLMTELYKWRNSSTNGLHVMTLQKNGKLKPTLIIEDTEQRHEKYDPNQTYVIKYPKNHKRYQDWLTKIEKNKKKLEKGTIKKKENPFDTPKFYKIGRDYVIEDVTNLVEYNGWTFDIDDPLDPKTGREMSENLGRMIMNIAQKISNHSYFRNYPIELKQDCQSYAYEKIIKGLFNYSFKYTNAFAYLSQACFNSFKSILSKYYKQINIKRAMTKKAIVDLDAELPGSSIRKSLNNQFEGNDYDNFQEF